MYNLMGQIDGMMNICIATSNQWYLDGMLINLSVWLSVDFKKESKCEVNMKSKNWPCLSLPSTWLHLGM